MVHVEVAMNSAQRRRYDRGLVKLEHEIMVPTVNWEVAHDWCRENLGRRWSVIENQNGIWACFWGGTNDPKRYIFCFAESRDAVFFALKWS
jgi:hypothetical protein